MAHGLRAEPLTHVVNRAARGEAIRVSAGEGVRYTVPSIIERGGDEDVHLRFRVRGVYKGAAIVVESGGKAILTKKRKIMVPSEMEDVVLKREALKDCDLTVEIGGGV